MTVPGFDLKSAERDYRGDAEFYKNHLKTFGERIRAFQDQFKIACQAGDYAQLKKLIHSIRGTAALLKVNSLRECLGDIESAWNIVEAEELDSKFSVIDECCEDVLNNIETIVSDD